MGCQQPPPTQPALPHPPSSPTFHTPQLARSAPGRERESEGTRRVIWRHVANLRCLVFIWETLLLLLLPVSKSIPLLLPLSVVAV